MLADSFVSIYFMGGRFSNRSTDNVFSNRLITPEANKTRVFMGSLFRWG